jgi:hypothetical protein
MSSRFFSRECTCCFGKLTTVPSWRRAFRLFVQHWWMWNLQRRSQIDGHTIVNAPRSFVSVSVIAILGQKSSPCFFPSDAFQVVNNSVNISMSYPTCVARFPVGAENKKNASGTPFPAESIPIAMNSRIHQSHIPNVPSRTSCLP